MDRMGTPIGTELEVTARIDIPSANVEPGQVRQRCPTRDRGHKYVTVLNTLHTRHQHGQPGGMCTDI